MYHEGCMAAPNLTWFGAHSAIGINPSYISKARGGQWRSEEEVESMF